MWVNTDTKPYEVFCICRWPDFITDASDTLLPLSLSLAPQVIQRILLISHCVCHSMTPYFFEKQYLPGSLMSNKFVSVYVCVDNTRGVDTNNGYLSTKHLNKRMRTRVGVGEMLCFYFKAWLEKIHLLHLNELCECMCVWWEWEWHLRDSCHQGWVESVR